MKALKSKSAEGFSGAACEKAERHSLIAEAAYIRAKKRGFQNGDPVQDWLAAEKEVDEKLAKQGSG